MQPSISKLTAVTNCIWLQNQEEALLQWFHNSSFQNFHFETTPPEIPLFTYILCHKVKALRNNEYSLTYDKLLSCNNYWVYDHFKPMIPREPHLPSWNTAKKSNTDLGKKKKKNRQSIRSHHEINKAKARVGGMIEGVMRAMGEWQMKFSSQDCCWPPDVWFICTPGVGDPCSTWLHLHIHMTNIDIIAKSRDITLLTKVHIVKAMFFPVVMYDVRVGP